MFEQFLGLPAHPLLVHAAVVFVPLQVLFSAGYALVSRFRSRIAWLVVTLSVLAPVSAFIAKLSGEALRDHLVATGRASGQLLTSIQQHSQLADRTVLASIVLAVLTVAMLVSSAGGFSAILSGGSAGSGELGGRLWSVVLAVAVCLAGLATLYLVLRTGDSGARAVWT